MKAMLTNPARHSTYPRLHPSMSCEMVDTTVSLLSALAPHSVGWRIFTAIRMPAIWEFPCSGVRGLAVPALILTVGLSHARTSATITNAKFIWSLSTTTTNRLVVWAVHLEHWKLHFRNIRARTFRQARHRKAPTAFSDFRDLL